MATILARSRWTSTPARGASFNWARIRGLVAHYPAAGRDIGVLSMEQEASRLRGWRNYHVGGRGWADIGYNYGIGQSGRIYSLRGNRAGAHATGHNSTTVGVLFIVGDNEPLTDAAKASFRALRAHLRKKGAGAGVWGHQQMRGASTRCPGPYIMGSIRAGELTKGSTTPKPTPKPKPEPEGLFGMTVQKPKTRQKDLKLPQRKWKTIPADDEGNTSILFDLEPGDGAMANAHIALKGLPPGANAQVRFYTVSYKKGTKTRRLWTHYMDEIVGTAGTTYANLSFLRRNTSKAAKGRSIRIRAEIRVFDAGVTLTRAQFNRAKG